LKIKNFNRIFLVLLIISFMFAAEISAANITAYSEEQQSSVAFNYAEEPSVFRISVDVWNFYNISNLTFQMTYDTDILEYLSFSVEEEFSSAMLSVNDNGGTITVALVGLAPLYIQSGTMITFEFQMLNSDPISFESKAKVIDCTDSFLNPIDIYIPETSYFYVKNDISTEFDLYLNSEYYNVNLYEDVVFSIGFYRNYGLYSGSFTLQYDANVLEFVGCEFSNTANGMILEYTDVSEGEIGKVNIAFAGAEPYSNRGHFIECIFLPKVEGYADVFLGEAAFTSKDLKESKGYYGYGAGIYVSDHKSYNYFAVSGPETVKTGDTFDVTLAINNNSGFNALTATLIYDTSVFEFVGAEFVDSVFNGALTSASGATPGQIRFGVVGASSITENGEFLKVKLRAINEVCRTSKVELNIIEFVSTSGSSLDYSNNIGTIDATNHVESNWIIEYEATCTETGFKYKECTVCGAVIETEIIPAAGHIESDWIIDYDASCWDFGYKHKDCIVCGTTLEGESIPMYPHTASDWIIDYDATCWDFGYKHKDCIVCGTTLEGMGIPPYAHIAGEWIIDSDATCWSSGYKHRNCIVCGNWLEGESIPMYPHTASDWIIDYDATADADGSKHKECTVCGMILETEIIPAIEHVSNETVVENRVDATCTANGTYDAVVYCEDCGKELSRKIILIPATGHNYVSQIIPSSCIERGCTLHVCSCGYSYADNYTDITDHTAGEWIVDYEATSESEGYKHKECTVCGTWLEGKSIPVNTHTASDWIIDSDATCTTNGSKHKECTVCGELLETEVIPATGHTASDWIIDSAATCMDEGSKHKECAVCKLTLETEKIPVTGHIFTNYVSDGNATCTDGTKTAYCNYGCGTKDTVVDEGSARDHVSSDWIIDSDATCTINGSKHKECTVCEAVIETENIPATGHSFGEWYVTVKPTCTEKGEEKRECANCECFETRAVDKVAHTYVDTVTPPTCTEQGYTTHTCSCGDSYVDTYTEALGHSFTNYVSDGNATFDADGTKTALCDRGCGAKDTVTDEGSKLKFNDITSDVYNVSNGFISGISIKTTVDEVKAAINEKDYIRVVKDGKVVSGNTALATGMKVQLMNGNEVLKEITVVVTGDTNGDGNISVTDMISVKAHILKKSTLTDAYSEAGDTNGDGSISITDFIQIKAHILGKSSLEKSTVKTYAAVKYNAAPAEAEEEIKPEHVSENACCVCIADFLVPAKFVFTTGTETIKRSF